MAENTNASDAANPLAAMHDTRAAEADVSQESEVATQAAAVVYRGSGGRSPSPDTRDADLRYYTFPHGDGQLQAPYGGGPRSSGPPSAAHMGEGSAPAQKTDVDKGSCCCCRCLCCRTYTDNGKTTVSGCSCGWGL